MLLGRALSVLQSKAESVIKTKGNKESAILSVVAITAVLALSSIMHVAYAKTNTLSSSNSQAGGNFGASVAISGNTIVVGAPTETVSGQVLTGRVYTFDANAGSLNTVLTNPDSQSQIGGFFGASVAISGNTIVVGAPGETIGIDSQAGRVYIFDANTGSLRFALSSPSQEAGFAGGFFGNSVAVSGSTVVVGAPQETVSGQAQAGHADLFDANTGSLIGILTSPNSQFEGNFGFSVAIMGTISGNTVVVGAPREAPGGHAYIFDANTGSLISILTSPNSQAGGLFGESVDVSGTISGNTIVVGAPGETVNGQDAAGRAYTF